MAKSPSYKMGQIIPTHQLLDQSTDIVVEPVDYVNPYDFSKIHRHTYFELMFFETGGGSQIIDFEEYEIKSHEIYLVCPGQVHLMKRAASANGKLIQFTNHFVVNKMLPWNYLYHSQFNINFIQFREAMDLTDKIELELARGKTEFNHEIAAAYLKVLLLKLFEATEQEENIHPLLFDFLQLVEQQFNTWRKVDDYLSALNIGGKKLNALTKKHLGRTALLVIHDRILLEAKRLMVSGGDISLKEIGFALGFDSQSSFSNFIQRKTGKFPKELKQELKGN